MKKIKLTQGKSAIVDNDLFEELSQYNWCVDEDVNTWYANRKENRIIISMHRQILGLKYKDGKIVDHINHNGLDNRRSNLRVVTHIENCRNHTGRSHSTSGYTGVSWHKVIKKWRAYIYVQEKNRSKQIFLGYWKDIKDAIDARKQGEIRYWGGVRV